MTLHFSGLSLSFQQLVDLQQWSSNFCRPFDDFDRRAISSQYIRVGTFCVPIVSPGAFVSLVAIEFMKIFHSVGLRIDPCRTPLVVLKLRVVPLQSLTDAVVLW